MIIKLNNTDVMQIVKALKSGWLDLSKVDGFKRLIDGYNPPKEITRDELDFYLDCLFKGWGYRPTGKKQIRDAMLQGLDRELLEQWGAAIENGRLYKQLVRYAFLGLLAIKGLGGSFEDVEPNFEFIEKKPPQFGNI